MLELLSHGLFLVLGAAAGATAQSGGNLPVVDLGSTIHRAQLNLLSEAAGEYYSFKNIPYAEPSLGNLRFRLPIPHLTINRTVDDGTSPRVCPQASEAWFQFSFPLIMEKLVSADMSPPSGLPASAPMVQSEDCLLLDIHSGAYSEGSKNQVNPAGLIQQSRKNGEPGIIFVAINYRLGLFGLPPRKPGMWDIASIARLYDQRLAMEWVRLNIRPFSGDPNAGTVIGESAGGGSVVSHPPAFGGIKGASPFQRAIIQSPAIKPFQDAALYAQLFQDLLAASNTTSYAELRQLPSDKLMAINSAIIDAAPFASSVFGPNIDYLLIPSHPGLLLSQRRVNPSVSILGAHNLEEGLLFTDRASPPKPASSLTSRNNPSSNVPYTTQTSRTNLAIAEGLITCLARGVSLAYGNRTRGYQFSIFPGIHAQEVGYTFIYGTSQANATDAIGVPVGVAAAEQMQRWFVDLR